MNKYCPDHKKFADELNKLKMVQYGAIALLIKIDMILLGILITQFL